MQQQVCCYLSSSLIGIIIIFYQSLEEQLCYCDASHSSGISSPVMEM